MPKINVKEEKNKMKKNAYKYAAMSAIEEVLIDKVDTLRNSVEYTRANYVEGDTLPSWANKQIERDTAIADFIEDFLSKM